MNGIYFATLYPGGGSYQAGNWEKTIDSVWTDYYGFLTAGTDYLHKMVKTECKPDHKPEKAALYQNSQRLHVAGT